ncbi:TIGR02452 family protein [Chitinophaga agrisoli]|uniref:TIGR02452 family protein n=1 Tax=Chitinophaga agrisoli TaxID=2607653 RepID=A0A5B2VNU0_9BACT|nr:TIGR02452 family protein [Chitinophaga agrisoli]KAA2240350.1 TIGR02452 family protein [Chitinophaga agrisoli]
MKKTTRAEKAQETLAIIEHGFYLANDERIDVKAPIADSINNSRLYHPEDFETLQRDVNAKAARLTYNTDLKIVNSTVLEAAAALTQQDEQVGCLNFASAKNPGGGFLGGAVAQEESLAMSSALYGTLTKHFEMYEYNRRKPTLLYSDHMIWSPRTVVFRNDDGHLLSEPYTISFITSPAINVGAIKQNRPEEMAYAEETMLRRMDRMLALFVHHDVKHILLGAWGCGVFRNDPKDIARYFASYLLPGGKYAQCFKSVVFAVLDRSKDGNNITAFNNAFAGM